MAKKRYCNVKECSKTTNIPLIDFGENNWAAFQIPDGKGEIVCYCPEHNREGQKYMEECLLQQKPTKLGDAIPKLVKFI